MRQSLTETPEQGRVRLQKAISDAGITSRRKAEELILQGLVRVNGKTVTALGTKVDPGADTIEVDGRKITGASAGPKIYLLINKPKGCISSLTDPLNREVVVDLIDPALRAAHVYPVGRLDYDAEGVLLLTNDGDFSNRLIHPSFSVQKKYMVKVRGVPERATLERLEKGVFLDDGKTLPARARLVSRTSGNSWIELTVTEGRNRLVKRMCQAVGHPVSKLKRIEFAGIKLGSLKPGEYRFLTPKEVGRLKGPRDDR